MQAYLSGRKAHNYRLLEASFLNCSARLRVCEAVFRKALQSSSTNRPLPPLTYKPACGLPFQYAWTRSVVQSLSKSRFPALPVSAAQPAGLFRLRHIPGLFDESLSTNLRLLGLAGQINHYQAFIGDVRKLLRIQSPVAVVFFFFDAKGVLVKRDGGFVDRCP